MNYSVFFLITKMRDTYFVIKFREPSNLLMINNKTYIYIYIMLIVKFGICTIGVISFAQSNIDTSK